MACHPHHQAALIPFALPRPFTRDVVQAMQLRIDSLESELAQMHLERGSNMPAGRSSLASRRTRELTPPSSQASNSTEDHRLPLETSLLIPFKVWWHFPSAATRADRRSAFTGGLALNVDVSSLPFAVTFT